MRILNQEAAERAVRAHDTPRMVRLDRLERFVDGKQYEGLPDFWAAVKTPLLERAPAIVDPVADDAIQSFVDLMVGEHRFPDFEVKGIDADALSKLLRRSRFRAVAKQMITAGLKCGTACSVFGIRAGKPFIDGIPAKWCTPEFDPKTGQVTKLTIRYAYIEQYKENGDWKARPLLFKRIIDDKRDVTYKPLPAQLDGDLESQWTEDPTQTFAHGQPRCPVVWWPVLVDQTIVGQIDGHAIHEALLDEIFAHDVALSQLVRATYFAGDPQIWEAGVEPGYNPSPGGKAVTIPASPLGGPPSNGAQSGRYVAQKADVRVKSPGGVWQYENPETKVGMLTLDGGSLKAIENTCDKLRTMLCDAMAYVPLDPDKLPKGIISGKALEALRMRQIGRCDTLRDDFCDGWLIPAIIMLAMVSKTSLTLTDENIEIEWPPYFLPSSEERALTIEKESAAVGEAMRLIPSEKFCIEVRKRFANLMLDGATDEDRAKIDAEIEKLPPPPTQQELDQAATEAAIAKAAAGRQPGAPNGAPPPNGKPPQRAPKEPNA